MSDHIDLYIVDEAKFPTDIQGTDEDKYSYLVDFTKHNGAQWESLDMRRINYMNGLEAVGDLIGHKKILAVVSYNNSPHNILGSNPQIEGSLGYFTPQMVIDIAQALEDMLPKVDPPSKYYEDVLLRNYKVPKDDFEYVYYRYLSTFKESASRNYALVVLHNVS